jgi:hypothetical protein
MASAITKKINKNTFAITMGICQKSVLANEKKPSGKQPIKQTWFKGILTHILNKQKEVSHAVRFW